MTEHAAATATVPAPTTGNERRAWLAAFVAYLAFGTSLQVFPPFLDQVANGFGISRFEGGLTLTAFLTPVVFLAAPLGRAVDRYGHGAVVRAGFGLLIAGDVATAAAPSFGLLLGARALAGVRGGIVLVGALKMLASTVPKAQLGTALGIFVAGLPVGTALAFDALAPTVRCTPTPHAMTTTRQQQ